MKCNHEYRRGFTGDVRCNLCDKLWLEYTPARASAPELLAALESIAALPGFESNEPYGIAARAAIAKAKGE